jgi:hypothetical protein
MTMQIILAGLIMLLLGVLLAAFAYFCVYMLTCMKELKEAVTVNTKVMQETYQSFVSVVESVTPLMDRTFGADSQFSRASGVVTKLSNSMPDFVEAVKCFDETMKTFTSYAFLNRNQPTTTQPAADAMESGFFAPTEEDMSQFEHNRRAARERINLSDTELSTMRTDKVVETEKDQQVS